FLRLAAIEALEIGEVYGARGEVGGEPRHGLVGIDAEPTLEIAGADLEAERVEAPFPVAADELAGAAEIRQLGHRHAERRGDLVEPAAAQRQAQIQALEIKGLLDRPVDREIDLAESAVELDRIGLRRVAQLCERAERSGELERQVLER